jgi:hypothetical protein
MQVTNVTNVTKLTRAEKKAAFEAERGAEMLKVRQEQLASNPLRMLELMARAQVNHYCSEVRVYPGNTDPTKVDDQTFVTPDLHVEFVFQSDSDGRSYPEVLHLFGYDWMFDELKDKFDELDAERKAQEERVKLARETWDSLTEAQRAGDRDEPHLYRN